MTGSARDPAPIKVIGLGLPRTGTSSLREALTILGFGPCYHMSVIVQTEGRDFPAWCRIGDGHNNPGAFDAILHKYSSVVDYPAAMYPAELYAAYPDAKFILTTRSPDKWEKSMKATILRETGLTAALPDKTDLQKAMQHWVETYVHGKTHHGRLRTHAQEEMNAHNERVKKIIPPRKLLVYEIGEGWDRLVEFLGVPKPTTKFPHVFDTQQFEDVVIKPLLEHRAAENGKEKM